MKSAISAMLAWILALILVSCGSSGDNNAAGGGNDQGGGSAINDQGGDSLTIESYYPDLGQEYPSTTINDPIDRSSYNEGTSVTFRGSGIDASGEPLNNGLLVWTSNLDGQIGTGESFTIHSLSPGLHLITLSVQGLLSINDQVRIVVGAAELYHDTVVRTISVGSYPNSIVITPDGANAYVTNYGDNSVSVIRTSDNTVIATIPAGNRPTRLVVTPNGANVFVINSFDRTLSIIQTSTNTVVGTLTLPSLPKDLGVSPDGEFLYVAGDLPPGLLTYRIPDLSYVSSVTGITAAPSFIRLHPDGNRIFMASYWDHTVRAASTSNSTLNDVISFPIAYPTDMMSTADGHLYIATNNCSISVIQTPSNILQDTIQLSFSPNRITIPNSSYIYMLNEHSNMMAVLQTDSKTVIDAIPVGDYPIDMAVTPDGKYVYVVNSHGGTVSVIGKTAW